MCINVEFALRLLKGILFSLNVASSQYSLFVKFVYEYIDICVNINKVFSLTGKRIAGRWVHQRT